MDEERLLSHRAYIDDSCCSRLRRKRVPSISSTRFIVAMPNNTLTQSRAIRVRVA